MRLRGFSEIRRLALVGSLLLVFGLPVPATGSSERSLRSRLDRSACTGRSCCTTVTDDDRVLLGPFAWNNGIGEPLCTFIDNEPDWCEFWDKVHPVPGCNTSFVDFSREVAIVLALGQKPDTCYDVSIDKLCREGTGGSAINVLGIEIVQSLSEECGCFTGYVQPLQIVRLPRPVSEVVCYTRKEPAPCPP